MSTVTLRHNKIDLALHRLRGPASPGADGRPLLHLHGLGERSPRAVPPSLAAWPGPVWALDFPGHGASTVPRGGGYFCELVMAAVAALVSEIAVPDTGSNRADLLTLMRGAVEVYSGSRAAVRSWPLPVASVVRSVPSTTTLASPSSTTKKRSAAQRT